MKVRFFIDNAANIHSCRKTEWIETKSLGYSDEEWKNLTDEEKYKEAENYWNARGYPEIYFEEKD